MLLIYQRQITIVKRVGPGVTSTGAAIQAGAWISATLMRTGSKTMSTYTTRRLGAMSIGTFCAGLAALKLTEDASRTGYTVDHVIAVGILAIAIYFGHAVATAAREARPLRAALCLTVAVGAPVPALESRPSSKPPLITQDGRRYSVTSPLPKPGAAPLNAPPTTT
jgi:hypothetical protein